MFPRLVHTAAALALAALLVPSLALGGELTTYSKPAFEAARDAGKPVVVFVNASWCVTCRRQRPVVDALLKEPTFAQTTVFVVDYDKDKDALRDLGVRDRSTLIAFNGKAERARSSFVTDPAKIRALFESAL
jgi:thiol-disulfide isomerase/thioredoxin